MLPEPEDAASLIDSLKRQRACRDAQEMLETLITVCSRLAAQASNAGLAELARGIRDAAVKVYAEGRYNCERLVRDLLEEAIAQFEHASIST
jgi:hypothetical protein